MGHGGEARLQRPEAGTRSGDPYQRGDGVFGNWTGSPRPVVYDGTCVTSVHFGMLRPLARGTHLATDYAEATKRRAKAAACEANNFDFMMGGEHARRHRARGSDVVQHQLRRQICSGILR